MGVKVIDAEKAVGLIKNSDTMTVGGVSGFSYPEKIMAALEKRFLNEGEPLNLTFLDATTTGRGKGFEYIAHHRLLKRYIGTHLLGFPKLVSLIRENKVEAYSLPLGSLWYLIEAIGSGQIGHLTKAGLNTSYDPRFGGGRFNSVTMEDLIEVERIGGEEYLLYKSFPIDVAIVCGMLVDEDGNLSTEDQPVSPGILRQAIAAKNSGGIVIVQAQRLVGKGSIPSRLVEIPGLLVDAIVLAPDQVQDETFPETFIEGAGGSKRAPVPPIPVLPLDHKKVIARRAAMELEAGQHVNLGTGLPMFLFPQVTREEGVHDLVTFSVEHGIFGGIHNGNGVAINPAWHTTYDVTFDIYNGGGLDLTFLGIGEVDKEGNVNVDKFGGMYVGPGGFLDISFAAKKVVCLVAFTAGSKLKVENGKLVILKEGHIKKFIDQVDWISQTGTLLKEKNTLFITERAVLQLTPEGFELMEIAPGIDLEKDVMDQMAFRPKVSKHLRLMDERLFLEPKMGLGDNP